ncbi:MAG: HD domain-containing protein [Candidatus Riflebacteria bacterium]|nr:HD domain-containing protein [Candidatus Riflebacteria bacterium]
MPLSARFETALVFAHALHADQKRKGTDVPYFAHLIGTTSIALEHGANEDEAIAALLHDSVEDAPDELGGERVLTLIRRRYGNIVTKIVEGCSDCRTHPKPPYRQRKEAYLAHLLTADFSVRLVSASDKLHNARAILRDLRAHGDDLWQRFNGGKDGTLWYYNELVQIFDKVGPVKLAEELSAVVHEIQILAGPIMVAH